MTDHSLPEDYTEDAPLLERLRSWERDIEKSYGWYEISDNAAAKLRADIAATIEAIEAALYKSSVDEAKQEK